LIVGLALGAAFGPQRAPV